MTEFWRILVVFVAAINAPAVALAMRGWGERGDDRTRLAVAVVGLATAFALFLPAALAGDALLDLLDVAPETFRIAAGIVMVTSGTAVVWRGEAAVEGAGGGWLAGVFPLGLPLLAGPAALAAAISYGVDEGSGKTLGALAAPLLLGFVFVVVRAGRWPGAMGAVSRALGALLVVAAVGLIVEGIRDV
jgi:multiple antibiotic resistance protein